jgi:hypothetical protein
MRPGSLLFVKEWNKAIVLTPVLCDQGMVRTLPVEIAGEFVGCRLACESSIAALLLVCKKTDWYTSSSSCLGKLQNLGFRLTKVRKLSQKPPFPG